MKKLLSQLIGCLVLVVLFTHPASAEWEKTTGVSGGEVHSLAVSGSSVFAGTLGGGVYRSTDNGTSWKRVINSGYYHALAVSGTTIFAANGGSTIYRSTDNGDSWKKADSGLTSNYVTSFAVSRNNVFAGTKWGGIFLSINSGTSWTGVISGLTNLDVLSLAANNSNVFAGTQFGGLFRSTDNGTSWKAIDNSDVQLGIVLASTVSGNSIFISGGGIILSTDNGTSWENVSSGLLFLPYSLAVGNGYLFAGATDSSVWRRPLSEMVEISEPNTHRTPSPQTTFTLSPQSRAGVPLAIELTLPRPARVTLIVHDLAGRETASLVNQHLGAGVHRYLWDTRTATRGCYVARLQTGATTFHKTIQILR